MSNKPKYINLNTGKETGIAFLNDEILTLFCNEKGYSLTKSVSLNSEVINENGACIGYIIKPGFGIKLNDPDYKWIIVWT